MQVETTRNTTKKPAPKSTGKVVKIKAKTTTKTTKAKPVSKKPVKKTRTKKIHQKLNIITLDQIRPNPDNPRKNFSEAALADMVASVRQKGVISPILVRPVDAGKIQYEIIYGERRFQASCKIAKENGGLASGTIPVLIRALDDSEAFDFMTIENLQRQDITELEEANSFAAYIKKNGPESINTLAEKTSITRSYIRRRVLLLDLPEYALQSWEDGEINYSHLEQLVRVKNPKLVKHFYDEIISRNGEKWFDKLSAKQLKKMIEDHSPKISTALFDLQREGCVVCPQNTDVQQKLFASMNEEETRCNNQQCFADKQRQYLDANWQKFAEARNLKTNTYRFEPETKRDEYLTFHSWEPHPKKCRDCKDFCTILNLDGSFQDYYKEACFGPTGCAAESLKQEKSLTASKDKNNGSSSRPDWHGNHFRDEFYKVVLPAKIAEVPSTDLKSYHLGLFALVKSNSNLHPWFAEKFKVIEKESINEWTTLSETKIFESVAKMDMATVTETLRESALQTFLLDKHNMTSRRLAADHIGVDVAKEFAVTEEYLKKKIKSEIVDFITANQIDQNPKYMDYVTREFGTFAEDIDKLKKGELMDSVLKSGVDLVGKVPEEVLNAPIN